MKYFYTLCTLMLLSMQQTVAQTYTFNWATSALFSWLGGLFTGNGNNVNSSTVNATVTVSSNQANAFSTYSGFTSPSTTSHALTTDYLSNLPNMSVGVNFTDKAKYADIVIQFSSAVKNVKFNIADIDKDGATGNTFDEVIVTGYNGATPASDPSISKLWSFLNFYTSISGNTVTANTNDYWGGNSASSAGEQLGSVEVDFGNTLLTSITVRFRAASASQNNPAQQEIAIGNISFQRAIILPFTLTSFNGALNNNTVKLNWSGTQEENLDKYILEKSTDGVSWNTLTTVMASGKSTADYGTVDPNAAATNYYRLKQVERNGSFTYSQVIRIRKGENEKSGLRLYPNPVISNATVNINSESKLAAHIKIYNQFGMQLQHLQRSLIAGSNNIPVPGINTLPAGSYIVVVEDEKFNRIGTTQFIKQ